MPERRPRSLAELAADPNGTGLLTDEDVAKLSVEEQAWHKKQRSAQKKDRREAWLMVAMPFVGSAVLMGTLWAIEKLWEWNPGLVGAALFLVLALALPALATLMDRR